MQSCVTYVEPGQVDEGTVGLGEERGSSKPHKPACTKVIWLWRLFQRFLRKTFYFSNFWFWFPIFFHRRLTQEDLLGVFFATLLVFLVWWIQYKINQLCVSAFCREKSDSKLIILGQIKVQNSLLLGQFWMLYRIHC